MINRWIKVNMDRGFFYFFNGFINLFVILLLLSCSYDGGVEHPVIRKFSWFSYIAAEDIQKRCDRSFGSEYRFVYNGVYDEQVRTYDIFPASNDRYDIKTNVTGEAEFSSISLDLEHPDLFKPWRPKSSVTNVSAKDIAILEKTLKNIGFFTSRPPLRALSSSEFYWVVSACIDGKFNQNAYFWPDERFTKAQFPKLLNMWDFTDVPINQPRQSSNLNDSGAADNDNHKSHFNLNFNRYGLLSYQLLE